MVYIVTGLSMHLNLYTVCLNNIDACTKALGHCIFYFSGVESLLLTSIAFDLFVYLAFKLKVY